ncbi:hypothetical protein HDU76_010939 [Blyttiomyces sp. JEL0837]|nr:hypothetical protein HDU76_010939 [Blyttiomyces sp. JEL0837]
MRCAGIHRGMQGKIKSVTLDSWTPEYLEKVSSVGNRRSNETYLPTGGPRPPAHSNAEMEKYIRNKYEKRAFSGGSSGGGGSSSSHSHARSSSNSGGGNYEATSAEKANFAGQLRTLASMGFTDTNKAVRALKKADGSLDGAIEHLVAGDSGDPSHSSQSGSHSQSQSHAHAQRAAQSSTPSTPKDSSDAARRAELAKKLRTALDSLIAMGFEDEAENKAALKQAEGQLDRAANILIENRARRGSSPTTVSLPPPTSSGYKAQRGATKVNNYAAQPAVQQQEPQQPIRQQSADPFGFDLLSISDSGVQASSNTPNPFGAGGNFGGFQSQPSVGAQHPFSNPQQQVQYQANNAQTMGMNMNMGGPNYGAMQNISAVQNTASADPFASLVGKPASDFASMSAFSNPAAPVPSQPVAIPSRPLVPNQAQQQQQQQLGSAPKPASSVDKESILSLFNQPPPQQQQVVIPYGMNMMGAAGAQQVGGIPGQQQIFVMVAPGSMAMAPGGVRPQQQQMMMAAGTGGGYMAYNANNSMMMQPGMQGANVPRSAMGVAQGQGQGQGQPGQQGQGQVVGQYPQQQQQRMGVVNPFL